MRQIYSEAPAMNLYFLHRDDCELLARYFVRLHTASTGLAARSCRYRLERR